MTLDKNNTPFRIFVVEDDDWYGELLLHHLSLNPDYEVVKFNTAKSALQQIHLLPDVVTLDYSLPDMKGDEVLLKIKNASPSTAIIIISAQEDVSTAINLLRKGAYDYFVKDDETRDRLWNAVNNIRQHVDLKKEVEKLKDQVSKQYDLNTLLLGNSEPMHHVHRLIRKAAGTNITVSLTGETGTGKELAAKAIHYNSSRAKHPFVAVNVATIPHELIESELFGHEKGAFTGAIARRIGKFEEANKGTLFLDEIAEMDLSMQSKLLRVLQEREISRVGANKVLPVDVRIMVATHKNLADEVDKGRFREDLYFRLLGLPIELPPLRDRGHDIILLAKHFTDTFARENNLGKKICSEDAKEKLLAYPFPGNVRELKATIELAIVMSEGEEIKANDITFAGNRNMNKLQEFEGTLEDFNRMIIRQYLDKNDQNVVVTAAKLGIGKSTIYKLLKENKL